MSVNVHITRINDTQSNVFAGLDAGQTALLTDQDNEHVHRLSTNYYYLTPSRHWTGAAWSYHDVVYNDVTATGSLYATDYLYHYGDTNTRIGFGVDAITMSAGGIDMIDLFEGASDFVEINQNEVDVDFIVNANSIADALFVDGANGRIGMGTSSPSFSLEIINNQAAETSAAIFNNDGSGTPKLRVGYDATHDLEIWRNSSGGDEYIDVNEAGSMLHLRTKDSSLADSIIINRYQRIHVTNGNGAVSAPHGLVVYNPGTEAVGDICGIGFVAGSTIANDVIKSSFGYIRTGDYAKGDFVWMQNTADSYDDCTISDEAMRLTNAGDLGINTTPAARLHVVDTGEAVRIGYDAASYLSIQVADTTGVATITPIADCSTGRVKISSDIETSGAIYLGTPGVENTWLIDDDSNELIIRRHDGGTYVDAMTIATDLDIDIGVSGKAVSVLGDLSVAEDAAVEGDLEVDGAITLTTAYGTNKFTVVGDKATYSSDIYIRDWGDGAAGIRIDGVFIPFIRFDIATTESAKIFYDATNECLTISESSTEYIQIDDAGIHPVGGASVGVARQNSAPNTPFEGQLWIDADAGGNGVMKAYSNGDWRTVAAL